MCPIEYELLQIQLNDKAMFAIILRNLVGIWLREKSSRKREHRYTEAAFNELKTRICEYSSSKMKKER